MSVHILDASAMMAYLGGEVGAPLVSALFASPSAVCYAHSMNLCEVYYQMIRQTNATGARQAIETLFSDGVVERKDMSLRFWQRVGQHKSRGAISLPDCFCISLAQVFGGEVVTTDHKEFDPLVPLNLVPINFIR